MAETSSRVGDPPSDDDVVIVSALRTPLTKTKRGGLRDTPADDLVAAVVQATLERTGVPAGDIQDVVFGSVLGPSSQRAMEVRMGCYYAGIPDNVPVYTVNRQCSSGLQAVANVAAAIRAGYITLGLAGGVESMTTNPMSWEGAPNERIDTCSRAADCLTPMGVTSENVAAEFKISRQVQDEFAARSHAKAFAARAAGKFKDEIVPVKTFHVDPKTGERKPVVVSEDDGIREGVTAEKLAKLRPVFQDDGSTTAGNSSQTTDGAAAVLLTTRREANRRNLPIFGVFRTFAAVGVPPAIMGVGPVYAIPAAAKLAGVDLQDVDVFEINEAFASQASYSVNTLKLDPAKVNPNGGAIALGHPLGATGARQVATLLNELKRENKRVGIISMCIGTGMGAAAVIEYEKAGGRLATAGGPAPKGAPAGLSKDVTGY